MENIGANREDTSSRIRSERIVFPVSVSFLLAAIVALIDAGTHVSLASEQPASYINYAYSSWIGTGYYKIEDRSVWILRGPFSYTLRESDGNKWGLDLLFPATLGLDNYDEVDERVGSFTFIPGVSVIYPVTGYWFLKPYGQIGIGKDFSGGNVECIWGLGIKSLAEFPYKEMAFELGNSLGYADHEHSGKGGDNGFTMWEIGLNARIPTGFNIQNRQNNLNLFFVYTEFMNSLEFVRIFDENTKTRRLYKFGVALGANPSFSILGFSFRGAGVDVTFGEGFKGIGLTTGFPF